MARYNVAFVKTGAEATAEEAGLYHGDADAWIAYGVMPNSNQEGWFFVGYNANVVCDYTQKMIESV